MRCSVIFGVLLIGLAASRVAHAGDCVPYVGHWTFWGQCSGDVPLGSGSAVWSISSGKVVNVYSSCGGWAGKSVRIDQGDGRYQYSHINAAVSVGQWVGYGTYLG